ncbi:MAG: dihydroorotate dehydrogenase-like protein [Gammaproteobacteria bacterium]|nr:dihydroorotate dehydrogenase-like protein [Gammaproteobacteria bacterium]MBQ0838930.1 dihydroorotate dehydrogenase-like protein [Gammaproteobacteria bacterium]
MIDLSTKYLGLNLKNPIVPSASPFSNSVASALQLQDAGAAGLIMHSLFEEKIQHEGEHLERFFHQQSIGHAEAEGFHPLPDDYLGYQDEYLEQLQRLQAGLDIPLIASLNGTTAGGWVEYAHELEQAGADALELNIYYIAAGSNETAQQVEDRYIAVIQAVLAQVSIPVTVKLCEQFSALANMVKRIEAVGAKGVGLFNRFYQPDIDLDTLEVLPKLELSTSQEALSRIRWTAILRSQVNCSIGVTGGFHTSEDVLKALLAGADVTHMCSALLQQGHGHIATVLAGLERWLELREYESVEQLKGSVSQRHAIDPGAYERANYINVLDSYTRPAGVRS